MHGSQTSVPSGTTPPESIGEEAHPQLAREWDAYVERHPDATFFHRYDWLAVVARAFRYRAVPLVARREGRITGVLPLAIVPGLPWGRFLVSTPQAVYGGPLADDEKTRQALLRSARDLALRLRARYVEYRSVVAMPALPAKDLYVTFRRGIAATAEENMAMIPRNQRRSIRIGLKSGLVSQIGGQDLLPEFYSVYSASVRNLGTPVFPRALFTGLLAAYPDDVRILLVRREQVAVAGVLTLFFRDQVLPYYGGALKEGFRYGVNDFMYWQLHLHGMERGYRVFDFGRSKRGSGSFDFKRHWGFEPTQLHYQYDLVGQREIPDLSPRNPRFSLVITAWKRMPLWLSRRLGPVLVRYFP